MNEIFNAPLRKTKGYFLGRRRRKILGFLVLKKKITSVSSHPDTSENAPKIAFSAKNLKGPRPPKENMQNF
jgi:hypothetical protein